MANTKQTITDELEQFYSEPVPVTLIKDNWKKKDDLTVTVNGTNYQIKRGVEVMVPRSIALAIERSNKQEIEAERYIESLKEA